MNAIQRLKQGYAEYFQMTAGYFDTPGLHIVVTALRDQPVWEQWCMPVWMVSIPPATVCCVSPQYAARVHSVLNDNRDHSLCHSTLLRQFQDRFGPAGWQSFEILYYPHDDAPDPKASFHIEKMDAHYPDASRWLLEFAGGVYTIQDEERRILSWVGVKDHGRFQELAVNTELDYRRKGYARALVAQAVTDILARKQAAVYIPDELDNLASYGLAQSLGFAKAGEMLYWEIQAGAQL